MPGPLFYTAAVCLFTVSTISGWGWALLVFLSHYPIDRWSLADKWLDFIDGRSLREFLSAGHRDLGGNTPNEQANYGILRGGFTAVVYTAADSTMHLCLMYFGAKLLLGHL